MNRTVFFFQKRNYMRLYNDLLQNDSFLKTTVSKNYSLRLNLRYICNFKIFSPFLIEYF